MRNERSLWRKVFGIDRDPCIDLTLAGVSLKAQEMVGKMSISGVQLKLAVKLADRAGDSHLEVTGAGRQYILKPQVQAFANLPENEELCMTIAEDIGIDVPAHCLVHLKDKSLAYVVKRFDREGRRKVHQEDFAQILEKQDKYNGIPEKIRFEKFAGKKELFPSRLAASFLPEELAEAFDKLLIERFQRLELV